MGHSHRTLKIRLKNVFTITIVCISHKYDRFKIVCWVCYVKNLWIPLEKVFVTLNIIHGTAPQLEVLSLKSFAICKPFHSFYSQMRLKYIIKHTVILKSEMILQKLVVFRGSHQLKLWLKVCSFLFPLMYPLFTDLHKASLPVSDNSHHAVYDSALSLTLRDSLCLWYRHESQGRIIYGIFYIFAMVQSRSSHDCAFGAWQPKCSCTHNPLRWNHYRTMSGKRLTQVTQWYCSTSQKNWDLKNRVFWETMSRIPIMQLMHCLLNLVQKPTKKLVKRKLLATSADMIYIYIYMYSRRNFKYLLYPLPSPPPKKEQMLTVYHYWGKFLWCGWHKV